MVNTEIDSATRSALREALSIVSALRRSMEQGLHSDGDAVWKHWSYRHHMRKYNDVVRFVQSSRLAVQLRECRP
jgi:hypothetical protein